jgi:hypothetical protein
VNKRKERLGDFWDLRLGSHSSPSELEVEVEVDSHSRLELDGRYPADRKKTCHRLVCR